MQPTSQKATSGAAPITSLMTRLNVRSEPATRPAECPKHGAYTSKNYIGNVWTACPICARSEALTQDAGQAAAFLAKQSRQLELERVIGRACIPKRFAQRTLDNYAPSTPEQAAVLTQARAYAENWKGGFEVGRCALFLGAPGTGKTHLACGIARCVMEVHGATAMFTTVQRAVRLVRDSWSPGATMTESAAIAMLTKPDLLILDEVGVQANTDSERNILFDIINERYEQCKPILLISNYTLAEVRAILGVTPFDRLTENDGLLLNFGWSSFRAQVSSHDYNDAEGEA